jgi:hypothetical protein
MPKEVSYLYGMAKSPKKRASKYDKKLAINGSFEDVIKVSVQPNKPTEKPKKQAKKGK